MTKTAGCGGCADAGALSQQRITSGDGAVDELAVVYGLDLGDHRSGETLADFMHERLGKIAVVGDRVRLGEVELVVRAVKDGRVRMVGLELEDQREKLPARRAMRRFRRRALVWSQRTFRKIRRKRAGPPDA